MERSEFARRRRRLFRLLPDGFDAVLVWGERRCLRYYAGIDEGNALLRPRSSEIICLAMQAAIARRTGLPVREGREPKDLEALLRARLVGARRIGIDASSVPRKAEARLRRVLRGIRIADVSRWIRTPAETKSRAEIDRLRRACAITARAARGIPRLLARRMTELELAARIVRRLIDLGAEGSSFGAIVAFGENAAEPHHPTGARRLRRGDLVLVDFGGTVDGYGADITRTFVFGRPTARQKAVYRTVREAQRLALDLLREGRPARGIQEAVSRFQDEAGHAPLIHGIGHGLGPLGGSFGPGRDRVITVEPGIYVEGWGGVRIEDDVLVRGKALDILTGGAPDRLEAI